MTTKPITIVQTLPFERDVSAVWSEEELEEFIDFIARHPETGVVIPETGGVRKVRWSRQGSGKRGGVRVIYFFYNADQPLYLLALYAKAQKEDLSPAGKRAVRGFVAALKARWKD